MAGEEKFNQDAACSVIPNVGDAERKCLGMIESVKYFK